MTKPIIDDRTLEACQRGDPEAFRQLFEAHKDRVYSIALCFFDSDDAAAKDITQEVFLKLMTVISQFQNRSEFSTWLHRIVTNVCLDRKRALRRFLSLGEPHDRKLPDRRMSQEDKYAQRETEASVRKVIAGMKPKLRIAILLKYFDDLPSDELAAGLGCSQGTVASRLNRAQRVLARTLSPLRDPVAAAGQDDSKTR